MDLEKRRVCVQKSEEISQNLHFNAIEVTLIGETFSRQPVQPSEESL